MENKLEMPAIGQTLSRQLMPQLADSKKFVDHLKKQGIDFTEKDFDTSDLKSTQMDFDNLKVFQMMNSKEKKSPIVVSRDNHILDGHHRWIADHNMSGTTKAFMVNLPILDLIKQAHDYNNQLNEEINHKDFGPMMDSFVSFASERLGIKSLPKLSYKDADKDFTSFGGYNPSEKSIVVVTKNRHPMDIFRTVAHELVHCKQDEDGRIKDVAKEGSTGSDIENEANAVAGQIMRWYAKANPDKFTLTNMVEETSLDEDLRKWFREKWVRYDTKGNIKGPCAREEGEGKPKCRPLASARAMSKKERAKSARRKRRNDPVADRKGKGEKPIFVATEEYLTEKNKPTNPELWARAKSLAKQKFDVYPSAYANGWASKWYKSKGGGWKSVNESFDDFLKENKPSDREWGTDSLTRIYADSTPGQTFPVNPLFEVKKKKYVRKKKLEEDGLLGSTLDMYNTPYTLPSNDGIGPEYGNRYSGISGFGAGVQSSTGTGYSYPFGTLAEKCGATYKKHLSELKDAPMGTVPKQGTDPELSEESPAWQRKEGKDPKGGLNKKGVASYRRENPGSKLQTAVTTDPSKLKKGSKKAKRRLSFCRRMKGMKKRLTSAKTARDPDSRINKALRKWNCE